MVEELDGAGLKELLPYRTLEAEWNAGGTGLYARYPLTPLEGLFEVIGHNMPAATMALPGTGPIEIVAVHPRPPLGSQVYEWTAAIDAFPSASPDTIRILAGDFNASLDHAVMRRFLSRGYADAADRAGQGLTPTWPANRSFPPLITIDHVVVDQRVNVNAVSVHTVPGTDHRAVFADLACPRPDDTACAARRASPRDLARPHEGNPVAVPAFAPHPGVVPQPLGPGSGCRLDHGPAVPALASRRSRPPESPSQAQRLPALASLRCRPALNHLDSSARVLSQPSRPGSSRRTSSGARRRCQPGPLATIRQPGAEARSVLTGSRSSKSALAQPG